MTHHKSLKRRVRARMAKTGERYTAARRQFLAQTQAEPAARPSGQLAHPAPEPEPANVPPAAPFRGQRSASDEALAARTGRTWEEWFAILDAWGAAARPHPEIARWLNAEQGLDGWWAQEVTVGYEMAIGRRVPGQRPDGFAVSVSKTVAVPVERLFEAFVDEDLRGQWLPGEKVRLRTATAPRTARFDWGEASRLAIGFAAKGPARSSIAMEIGRLPDVEAVERARATWRERLEELRRLLESRVAVLAQDPRIDAYLESLPPDQAGALGRLRARIARLVPDAVETISYGMPAFRFRGRFLVSFAGWKGHCSIYPLTEAFLATHGPAVAGYGRTKGSLHFTPGRPLPDAIVDGLVRSRVADLESGRR